jgi:hypothetical protein|tara:strand:+ start:153 stop:386 length:234 start_codon:yes stop_codon:yes gene_type:complete
MKTTESNKQLLERFEKRIKQLSEEQGELDTAYQRWLELDVMLNRLEGSKQAIEYLEYGKLPNDGQHTGMKDHQPRVK